MKTAFLGVGNMGSALVRGALGAQFISSKEVTIYDVDPSRMESLKTSHPVTCAPSSGEAVRNSEFIFLCVKPQGMKSLLSEINGIVREDQCLVSIAAGIKSSTIEQNISGSVPVVRVMPNTPALVQCGMSVVTKGKYAQDRHIQFVSQFLESVGKVTYLPEENFDAVTAVSGSGPAYFFYMTEALQLAAKKLGLPSEVAALLSRETLLGSAKMMGTSFSPEELRKKVTSPGGTTEAAIRTLDEKNWSYILVEAVRKAKERSQELSKA